MSRCEQDPRYQEKCQVVSGDSVSLDFACLRTVCEAVGDDYRLPGEDSACAPGSAPYDQGAGASVSSDPSCGAGSGIGAAPGTAGTFGVGAAPSTGTSGAPGVGAAPGIGAAPGSGPFDQGSAGAPIPL